MKLPHAWSTATPVFDDENLVSCAGLAPVMGLAEQTGLSELLEEKVRLDSVGVASAGVNPAGKISTIIAGMAAGADSIDDLQVVRSGGMKRLFGEVYAPATLGQFLREFTHGHASQLAAVARAHLIALAKRTSVLAGIEEQAYIDIDSLLRPVYGKTKQTSHGETCQAAAAGSSRCDHAVVSSYRVPVLRQPCRMPTSRLASCRRAARWPVPRARRPS